MLGCETVVVSMVEISEVEVVPPSITVLEGRSDTASVLIRQSGGIEISGVAVIWTVDDPEIATVSSEGVVQGLAPGTTVVRASSGGVSGAAEVTVLLDGQVADSPCEIRDFVVAGDLDIPMSTRCVLANVRVLGHVRVREAASLVASGLTVHGNVEANSSQDLSLASSWVAGEIRSEKGRTVTIRNSWIGGKVELADNRGAITAAGNTIGGTLKLEDNRSGPFTVVQNTSEKLECKDNQPAPIGSGNVAGEKTGQCVGL